LLALMGQHCRRLSYDCLRGGLSDLPMLARCCSALRALELRGLGAEGVETEVWSACGQTLRCACISFHYDAIDGPAEVRGVLMGILTYCPDLEQLTISGVDWPGARAACLDSLTAPRGPAAAPCRSGGRHPKLVLLSLIGSEARLSCEERRRLTSAWPGIVIKASRRDTPNLDW